MQLSLADLNKQLTIWIQNANFDSYLKSDKALSCMPLPTYSQGCKIIGDIISNEKIELKAESLEG